MSASITSGTYPRAHRSHLASRPAPFRRAALKVWNFMIRLGEQRARRQLHALADQYAVTDPALWRSLRESARRAGEV